MTHTSMLAARLRRRRRYRQTRRIMVASIVCLAAFSYLTNPFTKYSVVSDPFRLTKQTANQLHVEATTEILVRTNIVARRLAQAKAAWHIAASRFSGTQKTQSNTLSEIITEIHTKRFNPKNEYLISGDHFSVFYPRSLGIFYQTLLDPRMALDETDWQNKHAIYLKSTTYALETYKNTEVLSTTIVPIGRRAVTTMNVYAPPSDTLYSLLFALKVMISPEELVRLYPFTSASGIKSSESKTAAIRLVDTYREVLQKHLTSYTSYAFDMHTGLIKKNIALSSTKDSVKRNSAFYDNVVFWKTFSLAEELGIIEPNPVFLSSLKKRILDTYWDNEKGYFHEQLGTNRYSSDWLIVLMTGFLDPKNLNEQQYFTRSIAYIHEKKLNVPFALKSEPDDQTQTNQYLAVKLFASEYAKSGIWSNWGMEYTKALLLLAHAQCNAAYFDEAQKQLNSYIHNIERFRGYPEVYTKTGDMFHSVGYTSVRQTGWIVSFEQTQAMFSDIQKNWGTCTPLE